MTHFTITNWTHNPARRKHRFRCQTCARVIADGSDVVIERRGRSSHGYHAECFTGLNREAVEARSRSPLS